jgi:hypothetical protein
MDAQQASDEDALETLYNELCLREAQRFDKACWEDPSIVLSRERGLDLLQKLKSGLPVEEEREVIFALSVAYMDRVLSSKQISMEVKLSEALPLACMQIAIKVSP